MDKTNIVNVNRVYEETLKKEATAYRLRCVPKSLPLTSMSSSTESTLCRLYT